MRHRNDNSKRIDSIARRPHNAPPQRETGPRINDKIRSPEIRLIGADGENVGVVSPSRALDMAVEAGLDLVEISPNAVPPVYTCGYSDQPEDLGADGCVPVPDGPGLGVSYDWDFIEKNRTALQVYEN